LAVADHIGYGASAGLVSATAGRTFPAKEVADAPPASWPNTLENPRLDWAVPLQVVESSPLWENGEPHWLSRFSDHMEIRPR
jgi:hypothetical protein